MKTGSCFGASLFIVITMLMTLTCGQAPSYVCGDSEWGENHELWQASKIKNYNFIVTRFGGGLYMHVPFMIKVRNGEVVSREPMEEVLPLVKTDGYEDVDSIEKMFTRIQISCLRGDKVIVIYDKQLGYPEDIKIFPKSGGVDSLYAIQVKGFEQIAPND